MSDDEEAETTTNDDSSCPESAGRDEDKQTKSSVLMTSSRTSGATASTASVTSVTTTIAKNIESRSRLAHSTFGGMTGLVNLGNTCYMNAALQFLVNGSTDLRDYFLGNLNFSHNFASKISKIIIISFDFIFK